MSMWYYKKRMQAQLESNKGSDKEVATPVVNNVPSEKKADKPTTKTKKK